MRDIFKQLGFDEQPIGQVLAGIKARYQAAKQFNYRDELKAYKKEAKDLQKAVKALDAAISNLSAPTRMAVQDALPYFAAGIQAMTTTPPINVGIAPVNARANHKSIAKNLFVRDVAKAYRVQTGKEPTISIDAVADNKKGGLFAAFLLACAGELGIDSKGLVSRAQTLKEQGEI